MIFDAFSSSVHAEWNGDHTDEYCDTEVLRAECADGEVLAMEKAHYGRMKIGRCVEIPMGNVGCFTDVLRLADRRCSGRRVCELRVPDAEFEASHPCLRELKTYLEASYTCIKGDGLVILNRRAVDRFLIHAIFCIFSRFIIRFILFVMHERMYL